MTKIMSKEEFREKRKRMALTQRELAEIFDVSPLYISRIERGEYPIKGMLKEAMNGLYNRRKRSFNIFKDL